MSNLLTEPLPDSVRIGSHSVPVNTNFRLMIRLELLLTEDIGEMSEDEFAYRLMTLIDEFLPDCQFSFTWEELTAGLMDYYACGNRRTAPTAEDNEDEQSQPERVYSFRHDATYIYAAFMQAYHIDLTAANLHWWQFRALLSALPQDCLFARVIDYRTAEITPDMSDGQKEFYRKMKQRYALPLPQSEQEKNDAITEALMNGGDLTGVL